VAPGSGLGQPPTQPLQRVSEAGPPKTSGGPRKRQSSNQKAIQPTAAANYPNGQPGQPGAVANGNSNSGLNV